MDQPNSGIGNVTTNTGLVEMAMAYSRSRVLCAAARLGVADALGDEVRNVGFMAEKCLRQMPMRCTARFALSPASA
jgi:hypothetical protein